MANLKDLFTRPTKPALKDGAHTMILSSVSIPDVEEGKTPYVLMEFFDCGNKNTYTKYMFENDLNFFSRNIKEMLHIEEETTPLADICAELMDKKIEIPTYIRQVVYTGIDGESRTTKNWYFVTDYVPTEKNTAEER